MTRAQRENQFPLGELDKYNMQVAITGAGHIIRISSKSWFISLIPFKKWNLYNVYIHSTQTDIFQVFLLILMIITDN